MISAARACKVGLIGGACVASAASVASAANDDGDKPKRTDAEIRHIVDEYGACMVRRKYARTKAFVLAETDVQPPSPLEVCVSRDGTLRMSKAFYRMVFAQALLQRDFPTGLPATLVADPNEQGVPAGPEGAGSFLSLIDRLEVLGRCTAHRNLQGSLQFVRSRTSSEEEDDSARAVLPTLKACGLEKVLPQSINNVRGAVAVNLYRVAVAASDRPVTERN